MLHKQGKRVAILNIYGEDKEGTFENIPIINLPFKLPIPDDKWQLVPKNKLNSLYCKLRFLWQQHTYIKQVLAYAMPLADTFYFGSHHLLMSRQLLRCPKPCFIWGLRSNRMRFSLKRAIKKPIEAIQASRIKRAFFHNPNCMLFVSNGIIKEEFASLGVPNKRMVIREERCVEEKSDANISKMGQNPSFLVIGQLRQEKQVPFTIEAFKNANIENSKLYLIGRSHQGYEKEILHAIGEDKRIERKNEFLSYEDFNAYFSKAHFVLFADEEGDSCITNGTMMEALINHRPIICPNYNPYSYYINKYHVGITYDPGDLGSYANALRKATGLTTESFLPNIESFLKTIDFNNASKQLVTDIDSIIAKQT